MNDGQIIWWCWRCWCGKLGWRTLVLSNRWFSMNEPLLEGNTRVRK